MQAICDENFIFRSVDASWPGSVHDSRILKNSSVYQLLLNGHFGSILLGDEGYGITSFLMTPYKHPQNQGERKFNKTHCSNRVVIEQAFGQLKRRFPILHYGICLKLSVVPTCIMACFILHNVAKHLSDPDDFDDIYYENDDWFPDDPYQIANLKVRGEQRRNEIMELL